MSQTVCAEPPPDQAALAPTRLRPIWRYRLIRLSVAALLVWPTWVLCKLYLLGNVHEVIPGRLYRGAQPSAHSLEQLIDRYGIRTVLNTRGCCYRDQWYRDQAAVCQRRGVELHDVTFSAVHYPSRHEMALLIDILDRAQPPIFVHCRHGADRTGIAAMTAKLLLDDQSFAAARSQLGPRYGHVALGKPAWLDRFVQLYADWLSATGVEHAPAQFRHWVLHEYRGGACDAHFEKVERLGGEPRAGKAIQYRVVLRNTTSAAWHFRALKTAGYHVAFKVLDEARANIVHEGRAGMFDRAVGPNEKLDLLLIVPPLPKAGRYYLMVDMIEEGHCWFHQTGSEPWEEELTIRE